ncbi:glycosyltransferase [Gordonia Phage Sephiroth]|uniref:Glycosyltransferase n=1 Tax=Gordonia Phage Sephiroth TaxID=2767553 RepID=A0A7G9UZK1_9CAUD|nr:glucosyltransferase [Gordonia Phage Sephiroth]QNN99456.1 glycosyltransferase [Gordonia Phage Sephiroth]
MRLSICVLTVPSREEQARRLALELGASLHIDHYESPSKAHANAWFNALADVFGTEGWEDSWVGVVEDDAILADGATRDDLLAMLREAPTDIVSGYLGRARPADAQPLIDQALKQDPHYLVTYRLLHHVAVFARAKHAADIASYLRKYSKFPCDEALGLWAQSAGLPIAYSVPSQFDHMDSEPVILGRTVTGNPQEPRIAWVFGDRDDWGQERTQLLDQPTVNRYGKRFPAARRPAQPA